MQSSYYLEGKDDKYELIAARLGTGVDLNQDQIGEPGTHPELLGRVWVTSMNLLPLIIEQV